MRVVYADPPYVGQAKRHYGGHPDYGGEVDHHELIATLDTYDCWALSASMRSLPTVLAACPGDVLVLAWVKPISPPMGDRRIYSWEPVVTRGGRRPDRPTRTHLVASPPQFTFRGTPQGHVIGEKPAVFCEWLFAALGLRPDDAFTDLFPGSGAVACAWDHWAANPAPAPTESGLDRWLAGSVAKWSRPSLAEVTEAGYRLVAKDTR